MPRFRKKPKVIQSTQIVDANRLAGEVRIKTPHGEVVGNAGDWLITGKSTRAGSEGDTYQYVMTNDAFTAGWQLVSEDEDSIHDWDLAKAEALDKERG